MPNPGRASRAQGRIGLSRSTKRILLGAPLIVAAFCFGCVCAQLGQAYDLVLFPSADLLWLLLQIIVSLWLLSVTGGLAAALVRPAWAGIAAFVLSALAIMAGWWTVAAVAALLLYVVAGVLYVDRVVRDMKERVTFSPRPISEAQATWMICLVLLACLALYFGIAEHIEQEGFTIPSGYVEGIVDRLEAAVETFLPELVREFALDAIREALAFGVDEVLVRAISPFEGLIPLIVAGGLFAPLLTVTRLLAWVPALALRGLFAGLKSLGVVRVVRATREVERLIVR
ncbi:MAG: hypothetical protein E3J64_07805 [Anaerolineales bacterium]|nr:MAG: hypothetical protein E3J64_07805 [Anaerolineales bacterium]